MTPGNQTSSKFLSKAGAKTAQDKKIDQDCKIKLEERHDL